MNIYRGKEEDSDASDVASRSSPSFSSQFTQDYVRALRARGTRNIDVRLAV